MATQDSLLHPTDQYRSQYWALPLSLESESFEIDDPFKLNYRFLYHQ